MPLIISISGLFCIYQEGLTRKYGYSRGTTSSLNQLQLEPLGNGVLILSYSLPLKVKTKPKKEKNEFLGFCIIVNRI